GFTASQINGLLGRGGFQDLQKLWTTFDKEHRALPGFIGNADWQFVPEAVKRRNNLVHGNRVYDLRECKTYARHVLTAIKCFRSRIMNEYGIDPWKRLTGLKKARLQWTSPKGAASSLQRAPILN